MWSVLALEVALYHKQHELNHSCPSPRRKEIPMSAQQRHSHAIVGRQRAAVSWMLISFCS